MDRAQLPFQAAGLSVPSYVTNGNHDGLVQGNQEGNAAFEDIATGCFKALGTTTSYTGLDPTVLLSPSSAFMLVPPDPLRRFVDKRQIKAEYAANGQSNAHGYEFVDEDENVNSSFSASYYAWDPPEAPGFRFISIDTLSEGGIVEQSSNGNIDDPQFQWLERELQFASADDKLIVVFGHHPVRSLSSNVTDEAAGAVHRRQPHARRRRPSTTTTPAATSTRAPRRRSTSASRASARRATRTRRSRSS